MPLCHPKGQLSFPSLSLLKCRSAPIDSFPTCPGAAVAHHCCFPRRFCSPDEPATPEAEQKKPHAMTLAQHPPHAPTGACPAPKTLLGNCAQECSWFPKFRAVNVEIFVIQNTLLTHKYFWLRRAMPSCWRP